MGKSERNGDTSVTCRYKPKLPPSIQTLATRFNIKNSNPNLSYPPKLSHTYPISNHGKRRNDQERFFSNPIHPSMSFTFQSLQLRGSALFSHAYTFSQAKSGGDMSSGGFGARAQAAGDRYNNAASGGGKSYAGGSTGSAGAIGNTGGNNAGGSGGSNKK